jgi:hypothetical protein
MTKVTIRLFEASPTMLNSFAAHGSPADGFRRRLRRVGGSVRLSTLSQPMRATFMMRLTTLMNISLPAAPRVSLNKGYEWLRLQFLHPANGNQTGGQELF